MIKLYSKNETNFNTNGKCVLNDVVLCEVEEELNGYYGLELEHPYTSKSDYIKKGNIIKANTPKGEQLFRINRVVKNMENITVYADHITYDLNDNFLEDCRPKNMTGDKAIKYILNHLQYPMRFKGYSNITKVATAYYVRKNPSDALMGDMETSFINRWGGEVERDNFNIRILNRIGRDTGIVIAYKKNLVGIEDSVDDSNVVTRIMPTGLTEKDSTLMLPEKYIDSPLINNYSYPKIRHIHMGQYKVNSDEEQGNILTTEQVYNLLRQKVHDMYNNGIDKPTVNYTVDFIELSSTEEYKSYKELEKLYLGDIVRVIHEELGINTEQRVVKYKWNSLTKTYVEIELGQIQKSIENTVSNVSNTVEEIKDDIQETKEKTNTKFEITDDKISLNAEEIDKTNAKLELTANQIRAEVNDVENNLNSKIEITADRIESRVDDVNRNLSSRITQQADRIDMVVDGGGNVRGASIALAITESGSAIELISDSIYIRPHDGIVHFPNGSDIDTRSGRLRLRYSNDEYIAVGNDFDFYMNGRILASITSSGIYHRGERLAKMSDIPSIPQG